MKPVATASKRRVDRLSSPAASETASIPRFASLGLCTSSECCPPNGSGSHSPDASARADRSSEPVHAASARWRPMPCCAGRCDPIDYLSGCPRGTEPRYLSHALLQSYLPTPRRRLRICSSYRDVQDRRDAADHGRPSQRGGCSGVTVPFLLWWYGWPSVLVWPATLARAARCTDASDETGRTSKPAECAWMLWSRLYCRRTLLEGLATGAMRALGQGLCARLAEPQPTLRCWMCDRASLLRSRGHVHGLGARDPVRDGGMKRRTRLRALSGHMDADTILSLCFTPEPDGLER